LLDIVLLRLLKNRPDFAALYEMIPRETTDPKTVAIADDFNKYFEAYPTHKAVDWITFVPQFKRWHPALTDVQFNEYAGVFRNLMPEPDEDQRRNMLQWLADVELSTLLANIVHKHSEGDVDDLWAEVTSAQDQYRQRTGTKAHSVYVETPIEDLLKDEFDDTGVSWRLSVLNRSMRKLRPGDFGIIAARPDKGKTSFVASEITWMAQQLPETRNILWLNNEGKGDRIKPRLYQAALNLSIDELVRESNAGTLVAKYREAIGGRLDRIKIADIHGMSNGQVERIIEESNPGITVYDMIDNIKGFGSEARTDLQLEAMYQWARERSVKFDMIGLATSQVSNDGDGQMFPTLGMLKDSKTGKQGACDFQLMIGASNDPVLQNSRYISLPKNKLRRPDGPGDPRAEVIFDGTKSRYNDLPIGSI
jgi:replicative DNA helicase